MFGEGLSESEMLAATLKNLPEGNIITGGDDWVIPAIHTAGEERSVEPLRGKILEEARVDMKTPPYGFPLGRSAGLGYGRW